MKVDISNFVNKTKFNINVTASDGKEQYQSQMENQSKVNYIINVLDKKDKKQSIADVDEDNISETYSAIADEVLNVNLDDFSLDKCVSDFCSNFDTEMSE